MFQREEQWGKLTFDTKKIRYLIFSLNFFFLFSNTVGRK